MGRISVIVPVYNVQGYLHRCVDSILSQTYGNFELILVDDGSTDGSGRICDAVAERDDRVCVIHQANGGPAAARNAGIDRVMAGGASDWITFVDSDDWVNSRYLEALVNANNTHHTQLAIVECLPTAGEAPDGRSSLTPEVWPTEAYYVSNQMNTAVAWGKLYARECFQTLRYPEDRLHEDEFITYQILFRYDRVSVVRAPLYYYFQNPMGIMRGEWTPMRMDGLEAVRQQVRFFNAHGYSFAERERFQFLVYLYCYNKEEIQNSKKLSEQEKADCMKKMNDSLRGLMTEYWERGWLVVSR